MHGGIKSWMTTTLPFSPHTSGSIPPSNNAVGGTNIKGHLIKFNYSIFDSLTFSFAAYINQLVVDPLPGTSTGAVHAMTDLM